MKAENCYSWIVVSNLIIMCQDDWNSLLPALRSLDLNNRTKAHTVIKTLPQKWEWEVDLILLKSLRRARKH